MKSLSFRVTTGFHHLPDKYKLNVILFEATVRVFIVLQTDGSVNWPHLSSDYTCYVQRRSGGKWLPIFVR
jgi:hypothetical protein